MPEPTKGITPSQTVGPFFAYGLTSNGKYDWNDAFSNNLVTPDTSGERIRIEGRVFDGDGAPVPDENARMRMVSSFDMENTQPGWALCYRFNIVLRGRNATPMETK